MVILKYFLDYFQRLGLVYILRPKDGLEFDQYLVLIFSSFLPSNK